MLGLMYGEGLAVLQDYVMAYMWFNLSAASGYQKARDARVQIMRQMTPEQIAEGQRLAREWKPSTTNSSAK